MTRFEFNAPAEIKPALAAAFAPFMAFAPGWTQLVRVTWCSDPDTEGMKENAIMTCQTDWQYCEASIHVFPCFMDANDSERAGAAVHELMHIYVSPMFDEMLAEIDSGERDALSARLSPRHENTVQELAAAFTAALLA